MPHGQRNDYNHENVKGGRLALKAQFGEDWSALLTYGFQQQHTNGAWDEDPTLAPRTVARFGPEQNLFETNMVDFHLDGDVGIGDLVFASAFWNQERRQWNEYSAYEQNYNGGTQEGFTCLNDPYYGAAPFTGCNPATQFYSYNVIRSAGRTSCGSRPRRADVSIGSWAVLAEHQRSTITATPITCRDCNTRERRSSTTRLYALTQASLPPGVWYTYTETSSRPADQRIRQHQFRRDRQAQCGSGRRALPLLYELRHAGLAFAYAPEHAELLSRDLAQDGRQGGRQLQIHRSRAMVYADWAQGFRAGGSELRTTFRLLRNGVTADLLLRTRSTTTSLAGRRPARTVGCCGTARPTPWTGKSCRRSSTMRSLPILELQHQRRHARIYGLESNIDYKIDEHLSLQAA